MPPPDAGAVADRDHQDVLVHVGDDLAVGLDPQPDERRLDGGERGADRVAEDAEAERPQPLLPACAAAAGLRAGAGVHAVDHDPAELVDDQVHRPRRRRTSSAAAASAGSSGISERAREVVAGAERDQAQGALGELVAPVQRGDDRVQAAVAAGDHDRAAAGPVQHAVELAGVAGGRDLDVGVLAEHPERDLERVVAGRRRRRRW